MTFKFYQKYTAIVVASLFFVTFNAASSAKQGMVNIDGVVIPQAFAHALREGMNVPLLLHFEKNIGQSADQPIGTALLQLDNDKLKVKQIYFEQPEKGAKLSVETLALLEKISDQVFTDHKTIILSEDAQLTLQLKQLVLQLTVKQSALGVVTTQRSKDVGRSTVEAISSTLGYSGSITNGLGSNSLSYLSLNSITGYREHHLDINGAVYGLMDEDNRQAKLYKAMYVKDVNGRRFAAGMLDSWNLQSLAPVTGLNYSQIYGFSYGSRANSTIFDNTQSLTPIIAFLPSAGEVRLLRSGRLLSVQSFDMGNHEINTSALPNGIYNVDMEIVVNGEVIERRTQSVNKLLTPGMANGGASLWQLWGGVLHLDDWRRDETHHFSAQQTAVLGASATGNFNTVSLGVSGYSFDKNPVVETNLAWPISESININHQNMLSADNSWGVANTINTNLSDVLNSVWLSQQKSYIGNTLRQTPRDNYSVGVNINFKPLISNMDSLSVSYNNDRYNNSRFFNFNYSHNLMANRYGNLGLRLGLQQNNSSSGEGNNSDKFIALDFTMPMGHWFSAGLSHQNGGSTLNLAARQNVDFGIIRNVSGNVSQIVNDNNDGGRALNGGVASNYESKFISGNAAANSRSDGGINTTINGRGSIGWRGKNIASSGRADGNAGVIIKTDLGKDGLLTAKVNNRNIDLSGTKNYIALPPYAQYDVQIINHKDSAINFDIVSKSKNKLILYPGNVAVIEPQIKQMVTVSGVIKAEDGSTLSSSTITNNISHTITDKDGEFLMDVDKQFPTIKFKDDNNRSCVAELDIASAQGAAWVGDIVCKGLKTYGGK
ncbi:TcfC E-set like domain-containing protein [Yersinia mollaretii]|uniref:TcfC E-set like domain-containing protein n=1 Tax=Yersinia mollaretii TaxID=33060 RepID=UPI0022FDE699|nr:TcfC E-set like domain-containing protein [Yersinia mollaretii]MDA5535490.1 CS1-pili formation C-terminal domain-containing protein [Yersinia mollaretii]